MNRYRSIRDNLITVIILAGFSVGTSVQAQDSSLVPESRQPLVEVSDALLNHNHVKIIQHKSSEVGSSNVTKILTIEQYLQQFNDGLELSDSGVPALMDLGPRVAIIPTPQPPVFDSLFQPGDVSIFTRFEDTLFGRFRRITQYDFGPDGTGGNGFTRTRNDFEEIDCGTTCGEDQEDQF